MPLNYKPIVLIILDGFGIAPASQSNAVSLAKKPFFDSLIVSYPTMLLQASSEAVGLPWGEVGNSEVGHINIGSGVLKYQSLPRINRSIDNGQFFQMEELTKIVERVKNGGKLHIMGMIGNGGIHASQKHLEAIITFVKKNKIKKNVFLHLFLDGRDTAKDAGKKFMAETIEFVKQKKSGKIATICGREWPMDRNKNWDKIEKAYNAIILGQSAKINTDPLKAIDESYNNKIYDEEFKPTVIVDKKNQPTTTVDDGDTIIFFNFRADRARQITKAIVDKNFNKFKRKQFNDLLMITFTEYEKNLPVSVLFPPETIKNPIAKIISDSGLKQLHVAETEKYAHVTFFLNGMVEKPFKGEDRKLVSSPANVTSYDQKPEMSADGVTKIVIEALAKNKYDFIIINLANPDMVGHTGNLKATISAVEVVDDCISKIVPAAIKKGGIAFITADHGNAEEMFNLATGDIDKEHNMYPAPFIIAAKNYANQPTPELANNDLSLLTPVGILSDITPTILEIVGLPRAPEMTGTCLYK